MRSKNIYSLSLQVVYSGFQIRYLRLEGGRIVSGAVVIEGGQRREETIKSFLEQGGIETDERGIKVKFLICVHLADT
jgi:hypothetical protein